MRSGFRGFQLFHIAAAALAAAATIPNSKNALFSSKPEYKPHPGYKSYDTLPTSRYYPHQGRRECARRLRQQAKIAARKEAKSGAT